MAILNGETDVEKLKEAMSNLSCTSTLWVVSSMFDFVSVIIFILFVIKLVQFSKEQRKEELEIYG